MKVVVAQIGARRGYAVPAILNDAGMLERLYTDITGDLGIGSLARFCVALPFIGTTVRRLAGRRLPARLREKTITFPLLALTYEIRRRLTRRNPIENFKQSLRFSNALGHAMARQGFGHATHLHSMLGECGPLLIAAKEQGLTVVSEIYIPLSTIRIVREEQKKFPGWETEMPDFEAISRQFRNEDILLTRTDFAICPSESVRDDLVHNFGFPQERTAIVPYGANPEFYKVKNNPVRGRVLFAGTADLRKGIHYFAMAAEKLVSRGFTYEFRVAGDVESSVASQPPCRYLTFLGRVPRTKIAGEYATADIFVLPSLAEGGPGVHYEALACGIPVVTVPESRAIVRDNIEGRIVPSRDADALAEAMAEIIEDRQKRERMAEAARARARDYTWDRYADRLLAAVRSFEKR